MRYPGTARRIPQVRVPMSGSLSRQPAGQAPRDAIAVQVERSCRWKADGTDCFAVLRQLIRNFQNIKHTFGAARGQCVSIDLAGVILESKIPGDNAEGILNARFGQKGLEMRGFYLYLTRELIEEVVALVTLH